MNAAVETTCLGKRYGSAWALRDCSLRIPAGRVAGLVGPNGAGKSTLLSLLMGLIEPTCGKVWVSGGLRAGSAAALPEVAFLAQDHALYRRFSASDLLRLGRDMNPRWDDGFARTRLDRAGVPLGKAAGKLSGGQQAQLALTVALAKGASVVLLDEPVASLDPLARRAFMAELMAMVTDTGITVVLSSHVVAELERVCDYLVVLSGSRVQVAGDAEELLERHRRLVGPPRIVPSGVEAVIERSETNRQASLIARVSGPVLDPAWESHPVSLEDLALAYLADPGQGCLPRARLEVIGGRS